MAGPGAKPTSCNSRHRRTFCGREFSVAASVPAEMEGLMNKDLAEGVALPKGEGELLMEPRESRIVCSLDVGRKKCVYPGRWWPQVLSETLGSAT